MPVPLTYPGIYIEEIPSGVRTITGVATPIMAFLGKALRGPTDESITITSFGDFERIFGGLHRDFTLSYAVRDFFVNGGQPSHHCATLQTSDRQSLEGDLRGAEPDARSGVRRRVGDAGARAGGQKADHRSESAGHGAAARCAAGGSLRFDPARWGHWGDRNIPRNRQNLGVLLYTGVR